MNSVMDGDVDVSGAAMGVLTMYIQNPTTPKDQRRAARAAIRMGKENKLLADEDTRPAGSLSFQDAMERIQDGDKSKKIVDTLKWYHQHSSVSQDRKAAIRTVVKLAGLPPIE